MRVGIFGGSFSPVHNGHLALAREAMSELNLDKIIFVPSFSTPLKSREKVLPVSLRLKLLKQALRGLPGFSVSLCEINRKGVSYTVDTLRELRKIYPPPHQLFFIAGADSYLDLPKWKEPEEIMRLSEWIVAPRPSSPLPAKLPPRFHLLKMPPVEISASELREKGKDISSWVPPKVKDYLKRMKLYQEKVS